MASIKDLISSLKKTKDKAISDNEGWFRGGKFTPQQNLKTWGNDISQRWQQQGGLKQFTPASFFNTTSQGASQNLIKPIFGQRTGEVFENTIKNRITDPIVNVPINAKNTATNAVGIVSPYFNKKLSLGQKFGQSGTNAINTGISALQTMGGLSTFGPEDVAFAGWDMLKAKKAGRDPIKALEGTENTGLGDALGKTQIQKDVLNIAELPLSLMVMGSLNSKNADEVSELIAKRSKLTKLAEQTPDAKNVTKAIAGIDERLSKLNLKINKAGKVKMGIKDQSSPIKTGGEKKTFYHGTKADFDKFDDTKLGSNTEWLNSKWGHFFSDDKNIAKRFLDEDSVQLKDTRTGRIIEAELDIKKPLDFTPEGLTTKKEQAQIIYEGMTGKKVSPEKALGYLKDAYDEAINSGGITDFYDELYSTLKIKELAKQKGYDGIISHYGELDGKKIKEYGVFSSNQIKIKPPIKTGEVSTPQNEFKIFRNDTKTFDTAKNAKPVNIEGLDAFVHKNPIGDSWGVSEKQSGFLLSGGNTFKTQREAIDNAIQRVKDVKAKGIDINAQIQKSIDYTNQYKPKVPSQISPESEPSISTQQTKFTQAQLDEMNYGIPIKQTKQSVITKPQMPDTLLKNIKQSSDIQGKNIDQVIFKEIPKEVSPSQKNNIFNSMPDYEGWNKVYKPYGEQGKGFYYVKTLENNKPIQVQELPKFQKQNNIPSQTLNQTSPIIPSQISPEVKTGEIKQPTIKIKPVESRIEVGNIPKLKEAGLDIPYGTKIKIINPGASGEVPKIKITKKTPEPYIDAQGELQFPGGPKKIEPFAKPDLDISDEAKGTASIIGGSSGIKASPEVKEYFANWTNARRASQVEGILKSREFTDLDSKGIEGILEFQAGNKTGRFSDVKNYFDNKFTQAKNEGLKLNYKQDYLPQMWLNPKGEVEAVFGNRLGLNPSFTFESIMKNYQEGIEAGLTPRFSKLSDLIGSYESRVNKSLADRKFFIRLKEDNLILPQSKAPTDWVTLDPDRFPRLSFTTDQGKYTGIYKAPEDLAKMINNYLADPSTSPNVVLKGLNTIANWTSSVKNRVLSFGVPGTAVNAHGFNILARNVMASKNPIEGAVTGIKYMLHPESAAKYLDSELIKAPDAVKHGLTLSANEFKSVLEEPQGFKTKFGDTWYKLFEKGLFDRMLPALKLQKYQEVVDGFIKSGMDETLAKRNAAKFTNDVFGGINWEEFGKSRDWQNIKRMFILAPDWLETNINLAKKTAKSTVNFSDKSLSAYRRFLATFLGSYVTMNVVNKLSSGHWMYQNDSGNTFNIEAGYTSDGQKRYIRPFGTAADFIRIPYDVANSLSQGDLQAPARVVRNRLSIPAGVGLGVFFDTDYTGQPIGWKGTDKYGGEMPAKQRLMGVGGELATLAGFPAFMKQGLDYTSGKTGLEQSLLQGLELPFRYSGGAYNKTQQKISDILKEQGASGEELYNANKGIKGLTFSDKDIQKIKVGGLDKFNEIQQSKENSAELKSKLKGEGYYTSKDAPKNLIEKTIVGTQALVTDPKQLVRAIFTKERLRKVENGFVVLERKEGLGQLDTEDKSTQIDHIVPLEFGGTNPTKSNEKILEETKGMTLEQRNAYLKKYNLEALDTQEHDLKTKYQNYLSAELKAKRMTKKEVTTKMANWKEEILKLPENVMGKIVKDALAVEDTETDNNNEVKTSGKIYTIKTTTTDSEGVETTTSKDYDITRPIEEPKYTGQAELDKKLKSAYKSSLIKRINDIVKVYEDGQIPADEAEKLIAEVKQLQGKSGTGRAKTLKIGKTSKLKSPTIKISSSIPKVSVHSPSIKISMPKTSQSKVKLPTFKKANLANNTVKVKQFRQPVVKIKNG